MAEKKNTNEILEIINEVINLLEFSSNNEGKSKIIYKTHEEIFGKAFDDPKRRTPGIEKIIKFTGIEPSKNIDFMIENIINHKKTEL